MPTGTFADPSAQRPLWVGLTGGIASGKSAIAREFARLGVPVIDGDVLAREVVAPGQPTLQALTQRFGKDILLADSTLNRPLMRERIFSHVDEKQALEAIMHPAIRNAQLARSRQLGGRYQIHVMPLLVETHSQPLYDRILVVDCSVDTQLQRLLQRDHITPELAQRMLASQADRELRLRHADEVIDNNGPESAIPDKVAALHARYLQLAATHTSRQPH